MRFAPHAAGRKLWRRGARVTLQERACERRQRAIRRRSESAASNLQASSPRTHLFPSCVGLLILRLCASLHGRTSRVSRLSSPFATRNNEFVVTFPVVIASASRVFRDAQTHWTLQATCSSCLRETIAPLLVGIPVRCDGCDTLIRIDVRRTLFHRSADEPSLGSEVRTEAMPPAFRTSGQT